MPEKKTDFQEIRTDEVGRAEMTFGILDCLFSLGVCLADHGYIERADLAAAFEDLTKQHQAKPETQHPGRQYPAKILAQLFRAQVLEKTQN